MSATKQLVIIGAGIAGVACAYYLSQKTDYRITVIDKLPPLSFTTSKSGENFRAYWPQPFMNDFVAHSITLMQQLHEQHAGAFAMRYKGYDFVSEHKQHSIFGVGDDLSSEVNVLTDSQKIQQQKPYLSDRIQRIEHINNAGEIDVYAMGSLLVRLSKAKGVEFIQHEVIDIKKAGGCIDIHLKSQEPIHCDQLVLASGPFIAEHLAALGASLPIKNFRQRKFVFTDEQKIIPRDMPFTIFADRQHLSWTEEEQSLIAQDDDYAWLLQELPAGLHIKPEGQNQIKMGWAFNAQPEAPQWQINTDEEFADIVMRGACRFIPELNAYLGNIPTPIHQFAGYYTRLEDNLPILGALDDQVFVASALSGYGTMSACAVGDVVSNVIIGDGVPDYADYFSVHRFTDAMLMTEVAQYPDGQL